MVGYASDAPHLSALEAPSARAPGRRYCCNPCRAASNRTGSSCIRFPALLRRPERATLVATMGFLGPRFCSTGMKPTARIFVTGESSQAKRRKPCLTPGDSARRLTTSVRSAGGLFWEPPRPAGFSSSSSRKGRRPFGRSRQGTENQTKFAGTAGEASDDG